MAYDPARTRVVLHGGSDNLSALSDTWEFDIVGIYDAGKKNIDTRSLIFRYDYFEEARRWGNGQVGWYIIRVSDPARAAEVAKAVDLEFENSPAETKTEPAKVEPAAKTAAAPKTEIKPDPKAAAPILAGKCGMRRAHSSSEWRPLMYRPPL